MNFLSVIGLISIAIGLHSEVAAYTAAGLIISALSVAVCEIKDELKGVKKAIKEAAGV